MHTCLCGETSESIAAIHGVALRELVRANPQIPCAVADDGVFDFTSLIVGDMLTIPPRGFMGDDTTTAAAAPASSTPSTPNLQWQEIFPDGSSDFAIVAGGRYAALASASLNYDLPTIQSYLNAHGWTVTYAWEYGTPTRNIYQIDTWLQQLTADPTSNHRWVWIEANRTGDATTLGQTPPWPLTIYRVSHAFQAMPAPVGSTSTTDTIQLPNPNSPGCPVIPSKVPTALVAGAGGAALGAVATLVIKHFF